MDMTTISELDLGVLLHRGFTTPVELQLTRTWDSGEGQFFFIFSHVPAVLPDAEGLQLERQGMNLRMHHDGVEVLRRTKESIWYFLEDSVLPFHHQGTEVQILEPLRFIVEPYRMWSEYYPLARLDVTQAVASTVAGREAWQIPVHTQNEGGLTSLDIDAETGVVLAAESAKERIEVATVSYPGSIADPTWTGELAKVPVVTVDLSPLEVENHIRIYVDRHNKRHFHNAQVGDVIRLPLIFQVDSDAPAHRRITRRGQVLSNNKAPNNGQWEAHFISDGWHAALTSPIPLIGGIEVTGVIEVSPHDDGPATSFEIICIHDAEEMLIDALPCASNAPIEPHIFQPSDYAHDDTYLWMSDFQLPIVRRWSLETGEYCGEVAIPAAIQPYGPSIFLSQNKNGEVIAFWQDNRWLVKDGSPYVYEKSQPSPAQSDPELPGNWTLDQVLSDGLFSAYPLPPLKDAFIQHIGSGEKLQPLDTDNWGVSDGFILGGQIIIATGKAEYHLDENLYLQEIIKIIDRASYEVFDDLLLRRTDTHGQLFIRSTGEELCSIDWNQPRILTASSEHILVLLNFEELATWTPQAGWWTVELGGRR